MGWLIQGLNHGRDNKLPLLQNVHTTSAAHPASHSVGTVAPSLEEQQLGHDAKHSSQSCAEVKKEWGYTSTPLICPHGMYRDNLAFTQFIVDTAQIAVFSHQHILISQKKTNE
jgi:hypothetical protein